MPRANFLAFDFGAESGRAILGVLDGEKIVLEEIHRFPNVQIKESGHIHWNISSLFDELKKGLSSAANLGFKDLLGIGVDTWGVDFGLLGKDNQILGNPFAYRDSRTEGIMERAFELMPKEEMYSCTGIQFMQFNSIFQLLSMVLSKSPLLESCKMLLFMPDLFNFLLTGEKYSEYTIASTSQLLNAEKKEWESNIFEKLFLPMDIMAPLVPPGTIIGKLLPGIAREAGMSQIDVIAPACHDTACAVAAVPAKSSNWAYLSSGTWSVVGIEVDEPIINEITLKNNFTNEGGINQKIRFLRNTMGLWLLQRCIKSWEKKGESLTYGELTNLTEKTPAFKCFIDPDDRMFLNPEDMPTAIVEFCKKTQQPIPGEKGEYVRCIFESLALKYRFIIDRIKNMCKNPLDVLHIVGGGSQNELLNQFSANATGLPVVAGPVEATAAGNILIQAVTKKELTGIEEGRRLVSRSFPLKYYEPEFQEKWNEVYEKTKWMFT
jgi:rhamnulokinase